MISLDRLRVHLRKLNASAELADRDITLQCVFLVDLEGLSIQSVNLKILTWFMKEVVPRYPGMLGAVFFLNYSWTYGVTWSVAKRLLPKSAVARVFFPSREELLNYCSASALPSSQSPHLRVVPPNLSRAIVRLRRCTLTAPPH